MKFLGDAGSSYRTFLGLLRTLFLEHRITLILRESRESREISHGNSMGDPMEIPWEILWIFYGISIENL